MSTRPLSWLVSVLTLAAALPAPAAAQTSFDLGPLVAWYRPMGSFEPASIYSTILPGKPSDLSGLAWGVEGRVWFGRRLGVQLQVAEASSTIGAINTPAGFTSGPTPAQVQFVTAQALYNFYPSPERARLWLNAGTGVVRHGGPLGSTNFQFGRENEEDHYHFDRRDCRFGSGNSVWICQSAKL